MIELKNIEKSYKNKKALRNIEIELKSGYIYGLIGKKYSGKSSLLNIISGQVKASNGEIKYEGLNVYENPKVVEEIALVKENGGVIDNLKVKKIMEFAKIAYKNWDEVFKDLLVNEFEIDLNQHYYKMTDEKQALVRIIIGLASRAKWTLFDEPIKNLSKINSHKFCEIIRRDLEEYPRTIVISSSTIDCSIKLFDKIIILRDGKVLLDEDIDVVKQKLYYASGQDDILDIQLEKNIIFREEFGNTTVLGIYDDIEKDEIERYKEKNISISDMPIYRGYSYFTEEYMGYEKEEDIDIVLKMYGDHLEEPDILIETEELKDSAEEKSKVVKSEIEQTINTDIDSEIVETISKDEILVEDKLTGNLELEAKNEEITKVENNELKEEMITETKEGEKNVEPK
ncbi:MAG: ATP-binding cassette domain-containing protein [Andreesenia angusta]|nr:ATP-binding cassette domain-containing protein [Andreesenia angusta]